jgi:hypothetical protein
MSLAARRRRPRRGRPSAARVLHGALVGDAGRHARDAAAHASEPSPPHGCRLSCPAGQARDGGRTAAWLVRGAAHGGPAAPDGGGRRILGEGDGGRGRPAGAGEEAMA